MTTNLHIARVETGGLTFGKPTVTQYAVCVNDVAVTPYVPIRKILGMANVVFEACQAVDLGNTVRWDKDDNTFLVRLFQEHESYDNRTKDYS